MLFLERLAEERIREAIAQGAFADLPGAGKPLVQDDDLLVPEALRVAHRILKNAGCVPVEIEMRREIAELRGALRVPSEDETARRRALARLAVLEASLERSGRGSLVRSGPYRARLFERFAGGDGSG